MKKVLALILALVLVLSLAACGGNDTKESVADKTSSQTETPEETIVITKEKALGETETPSTVKGSTVELTLDNWQKFFQIKINYVLRKNEWGEVDGILDQVLFERKDNVRITDIQDGRISYKWKITETSMIHFDKKTEDYSFSDTTPESNETVDGEGSITGGLRSDGNYYCCSWLNPLKSNEYTDAGNEYTARVITNTDVDITRIKGTITVLSN